MERDGGRGGGKEGGREGKQGGRGRGQAGGTKRVGLENMFSAALLCGDVVITLRIRDFASVIVVTGLEI